MLIFYYFPLSCPSFFSPKADKLQLAVYTFPISTLVSFITPWLLRGDMVGLDELAPSSHVHFGRGIGWVFFYCSLLLIAPLLLTLIVVVRFKKIVEVSFFFDSMKMNDPSHVDFFLGFERTLDASTHIHVYSLSLFLFLSLSLSSFRLIPFLFTTGEAFWDLLYICSLGQLFIVDFVRLKPFSSFLSSFPQPSFLVCFLFPFFYSIFSFLL